MRENRDILMKFIIVAIFIIISIMVPKNVLAANINGSNKVVVDELWTKATVQNPSKEKITIYCTDTLHHLATGKTYTVSEEWTVAGNTVKKNNAEISKKTDFLYYL